MKPITLTLAALLSLAAAAALAGPLRKGQVPADAKWLVHLDIDNFLASQLGGIVSRDLIDKHVARQASELKTKFGIDLDWRKIHGLTAYGVDYKARADSGGVLILHSDLDIINSLDVVIGILAATAGENNPLKKLPGEAFPTYALKDKVFGAPLPGNLFVLSRSRQDLDKACRVIAGKAPNLVSTKALKVFPGASEGFFLLGIAEAFSEAPWPPQAKILKNADGGQFVAGEKAGKFYFKLALSANDADAAAQIQQVLQGLLALAALTQDKNKDLQLLTQGTKIGSNDKTVTMEFELPVSAVMDRVGELSKEHSK